MKQIDVEGGYFLVNAFKLELVRHSFSSQTGSRVVFACSEYIKKKTMSLSAEVSAGSSLRHCAQNNLSYLHYVTSLCGPAHPFCLHILSSSPLLAP